MNGRTWQPSPARVDALRCFRSPQRILLEIFRCIQISARIRIAYKDVTDSVIDLFFHFGAPPRWCFSLHRRGGPDVSDVRAFFCVPIAKKRLMSYARLRHSGYRVAQRLESLLTFSRCSRKQIFLAEQRAATTTNSADFDLGHTPFTDAYSSSVIVRQPEEGRFSFRCRSVPNLQELPRPSRAVNVLPQPHFKSLDPGDRIIDGVTLMRRNRKAGLSAKSATDV